MNTLNEGIDKTATAGRPPTGAEVEALLEAIWRHSAQPWADVLLVCLVLVTGAPPSALVRVRLRDLDTARLMLTLRTQHGQVFAVAPIPDDLAAELVEFATAHGVTKPSARIFVVPDASGGTKPMSTRHLASTFRTLERVVALTGGTFTITGLWAMASSTRDIDIELMKVSLPDVDTAEAAAAVGRWGGWHPLLGAKHQ